MPSFWPSSSSGPSAAAAEGDPADPAHLSASDFVDGDHPRDEVYGASFQTRSVALDGLTIHFAADAFDDDASPALAERIAADHDALRALGGEWTHPVEVYVVPETITGAPVAAGSQLFCEASRIESREYLPYLTSQVFALDPWWQCVGLSRAALKASAPSPEALSDRLNTYAAKRPASHILSLAPCYFIEAFADQETRALSEEIAQSLTEFILSRSGLETFLTEGSDPACRAAWREELGLSLSLDDLDTPEAARVSALPLSQTADIPWIIQERNFQLNLQSVDWMPAADDVYPILVELYRGVDQLYARLERDAPVFCASLRDRSFRTLITVCDSDSAPRSWTKIDGSQAVVLAREDTPCELVHGLMPMGSSEERHWLCEGLVTYLSAPCIPYAADPAVVDSLASGAAAAKLSAPLREIHDEIAAIFQEMTGRDISQARQMDQAISLIYQAAGYAACLHPEYQGIQGFPFVGESVAERTGIDRKYPENELSYAQAMVFARYLVEKYGLDAILQAETDLDAYHALFPNTAAFQAEYDLFLGELDLKR